MKKFYVQETLSYASKTKCVWILSKTWENFYTKITKKFQTRRKILSEGNLLQIRKSSLKWKNQSWYKSPVRLKTFEKHEKILKHRKALQKRNVPSFVTIKKFHHHNKNFALWKASEFCILAKVPYTWKCFLPI